MGLNWPVAEEADHAEAFERLEAERIDVANSVQREGVMLKKLMLAGQPLAAIRDIGMRFIPSAWHASQFVNE